MLCEECQDGKRERRGFSGARLRRADQISARKNNRKRAELNRSRLDEAHRLSPAHDFRRKSETIKRHEAKSKTQMRFAQVKRLQKLQGQKGQIADFGSNPLQLCNSF
jgi:hypothetical protein